MDPLISVSMTQNLVDPYTQPVKKSQGIRNIQLMTTARTAVSLWPPMSRVVLAHTAMSTCRQYQAEERPPRYCSARSPPRDSRFGPDARRSNNHAARRGGCVPLIRLLLAAAVLPARGSSVSGA